LGCLVRNQRRACGAFARFFLWLLAITFQISAEYRLAEPDEIAEGNQGVCLSVLLCLVKDVLKLLLQV
jgi:hypothetical protein